MQLLLLVVWSSGLYPLAHTWLANRYTSLFAAIQWTLIAWFGWGLVIASRLAWPGRDDSSAAYLALSLTGCAAVAVLGARRPQVTAWNFVLLALLAVDLLPVAEGFISGGAPDLGMLRVICVAGTVAVGVVNYLPTRFALTAILVALAAGAHILLIASDSSPKWPLPVEKSAAFEISIVPWVALGTMRRRIGVRSEFDAVWLDFRDRFGFVWGQRVREQFNNSAVHAGWPVILRWQGLRLVKGAALPDPKAQVDMVQTLRALLKRFQAEEGVNAPGLPP
jgi:hypothetical protein